MKIISVTLTLAQIEALRLICEEENINRSEWFRQRVDERKVALYDLTNHTCGGPHIQVKDHKNIWLKIGKSNPFIVGKYCRACWPDGKPKSPPTLSTRYRNDDGSPVYELVLENNQMVMFS